MEWYSLSIQELIRKTGCRPEYGLSAKEAKRRLQKHGPNELAQEKGPGLFKKFIS